MDTNVLQRSKRVRLMGATLAALAATTIAGCGLEKQEAPPLSGPSGLSQSMTMTASTDRLPQDGVSKAVITLTLLKVGEPVKDWPITWSVSTNDGSQVEADRQVTLTNSQGQATTTITAPAAPPLVPTTPLRLRVSAQPQGMDASTNAPGWETQGKRSVELELIPPPGTPMANRLPVASFTIAPIVGNIGQTITFNASATTDEGTICQERCTYAWDFGDFSTSEGMVVTHEFTLPQSYSISLTVTDNRGGVSSSTRSLTINGPAAPTVSFSVLPASPTVGVAAVVDASLASVGAGATIAQYSFNFGDGGAVQSETPAVSHTWTSAGTFPVTVTVTDSLGRTATSTLVITVAAVAP
jgi:PKD repeat protein